VSTPDTLGWATDVLASSAKTSYGGRGPEQAYFSGSLHGWLCTSGDMPTWWQVQLTSAKVVTGYSITRESDTPTRNPNAWTFLGSNNGSSWTTLDTQTGITWPTANEIKSFTFTNTTAYAYYKVNITANNGDSYTGLAQITFVGAHLEAVSLAVWLKADAITGFADGASLTSWVDSSGNANTPATTVGTAPIYRASGGPGGLPCVDHTIAAGGLSKTTATGIPKGDYTYFTMVQSGSTAIQNLMNAYSAGNAQLRLNTLKVEIDESGLLAIKTSTAALALNTWSLVLVTFSAQTELVHFDVAGTVEDYALGGMMSFTTGSGLTYGNFQGTSNYFNGKMAEIGLFNGKLSSADLASLKTYMTTKWIPAAQGALRRAKIVRSVAAQHASRW
jgi:hypothetical protein